MNILDWIDVGKVSAERDDLLSEYFFDNGVLNKVLNSPSSFLVLGRKGSGKTAVFRHLTENPNEFIGVEDILISLSFEDYNWNIHSLLKNSHAAESLSYKQSWRFVILVEIIKAYADYLARKKYPIPLPIAKAKKLLQKLFDEPIPSIYQIVGRKLLKLSTFRLPKGGLDIEGGDLDSIELSGGEVSFENVNDNDTLKEHLSNNIENIINFLESSIERVMPLDRRIFLCFDRIDEAWDEISMEVSKKVIAGLISASDSITSQYRGAIRPIVFLREDIFDVLSLNDANKLREDCGALLHWDKDSLFKLLLKRLNYYAGIKKVPFVTEIDSIFDKKEMRQRTKPSNYLLKRSMMRPRDLISIMKKTISTMKDKAEDPFEETPIEFEKLEAEQIYAAEPGYSEWLKQEIIEEWGVQKPIIHTLLSAFQNFGSTNFTKDDLADELKKLNDDFDSQKLINHLRFLFENSVIGFKIGESAIWRYKCFYPSQGFIESNVYRVHEGLVRSLNLKEPRDRE